MMKKMLIATSLFTLSTLLSVASASELAVYRDPLDAQTLTKIKTQFSQLITLANRHDIKAIHNMFWQSPSTLLVAKSAVPAEGNWAGYWGNEAIDKKLHDIANSGPVELTPDYAKLKIVGVTKEVAQSYAPVNITVSYAGQSGTPKPFLLIINWIKIAQDWKVAAEILLPVPPSASVK